MGLHVTCEHLQAAPCACWRAAIAVPGLGAKIVRPAASLRLERSPTLLQRVLRGCKLTGFCSSLLHLFGCWWCGSSAPLPAGWVPATPKDAC